MNESDILWTINLIQICPFSLFCAWSHVTYTVFYVPYLCFWFHTLSKWVPLEHISGINSARENGTHLGNDDCERETLDGQSCCEGEPIMLQYSGENINILSCKVEITTCINFIYLTSSRLCVRVGRGVICRWENCKGTSLYDIVFLDIYLHHWLVDTFNLTSDQFIEILSDITPWTESKQNLGFIMIKHLVV